MNDKNIVWAFYSYDHYKQQIDSAQLLNQPPPKDVYYKNVISGEWLIVTAVFDCLEKAKRYYCYPDLKYLGPVDKTTKTTVDQGQQPIFEEKTIGEKLVISKKFFTVKKI